MYPIIASYAEFNGFPYWALALWISILLGIVLCCIWSFLTEKRRIAIITSSAASIVPFLVTVMIVKDFEISTISFLYGPLFLVISSSLILRGMKLKENESGT